MDSPLVSIIVPYYKRPDSIGRTLDTIFEQDYSNRELILVDNHSEDNLKELVSARATSIRIIELRDNLGACAARNAGIKVARGQVVIFLDDDMGFVSPFEITKVLQSFVDHPNVHALAFRIVDPDTGELRLREWCHARYWRDFSETEFDTHWFCEGACAFRREVFDTCGLYYEPLFYGPEGWDLVLRMFNNNFRILYCPQLRIWHRPSVKGRTSHRQFYYFTRDYLWMSYKDYDLFQGVRFFVPKLLMMAYFTVRSNAYRPFLRGLWDGMTGLRRVHPDRTPATKATLQYVAELERWRPSWMVRFARHRTELQF